MTASNDKSNEQATGSFSVETRGCKIRISDGREFSGKWNGKAEDSSGGVATATNGDQFHFALGGPWYGYAYINEIRKKRKATEYAGSPDSTSNPEVARLQREWYYYTASPRSESERLFREWSMGMGAAVGAAVAEGRQVDASLAVLNAARRMEPVERKLRLSMAAAGHSESVIDEFLSREKARMAAAAEKKLRQSR
jgi:hypothetical protein